MKEVCTRIVAVRDQAFVIFAEVWISLGVPSVYNIVVSIFFSIIPIYPQYSIVVSI